MVVKQDPRFSRRSQCHGTLASPFTSAIHPTKGTYPTTAPIPRTDEVSLHTWARLNTELGEIDSRELPLQLAFTKRSRSGAQPSEPSPSPPAVLSPSPVARLDSPSDMRKPSRRYPRFRVAFAPTCRARFHRTISVTTDDACAQTVEPKLQLQAQTSSSSSSSQGTRTGLGP